MMEANVREIQLATSRSWKGQGKDPPGDVQEEPALLTLGRQSK